MNGLVTIADRWREWGDPRLTIAVLNNADLNMVTWEQRGMEGDPRYVPSQRLPGFPYARYAELLGLGGLRVDRPEQIAPAWDAALRADRPTVLEFVTDPNVPMTPPHIEGKQLKAYMSALLHGDAEGIRLTIASFKEAWASLFPPSAAS